MKNITENVKFEERVDCEDSQLTTLYFIAPKEWLNQFTGNEYPEAVSMEVSLEFPFCCVEANKASVSVSPTLKCGGGYTDYDWTDIDLPVDEIEALISLMPNVSENKATTYVLYINESYVRDTQFFCPEGPVEDKGSIEEMMSDDDNWDDTNKFGLFVGIYKWANDDLDALRSYVAKQHGIWEDVLVCVPVNL